MILNIFILVLAVEIIAKRPPERPPDGGPIIKYQCQPGKRLWCSRNGVPPDPRIKSQLFGPFFPIPPVKCSRAPDPDGPGQVNVARAPDPDGPGQVNVKCGPFRPIPPVKCPTGGGPIGDPKPPWWGEPVKAKRKVKLPNKPDGCQWPRPPDGWIPKTGKRLLPCSLESCVV